MVIMEAADVEIFGLLLSSIDQAPKTQDPTLPIMQPVPYFV